MKNSKYCSIFFQKTLRYKIQSPQREVFILKCVNYSSKNRFVKVKINLDILLSEITFGNSVVKKLVAYFLKYTCNNYHFKKIFISYHTHSPTSARCFHVTKNVNGAVVPITLIPRVYGHNTGSSVSSSEKTMTVFWFC